MTDAKQLRESLNEIARRRNWDKDDLLDQIAATLSDSAMDWTGGVQGLLGDLAVRCVWDNEEMDDHLTGSGAIESSDVLHDIEIKRYDSDGEFDEYVITYQEPDEDEAVRTVTINRPQVRDTVVNILARRGPAGELNEGIRETLERDNTDSIVVECILQLLIFNEVRYS